MDTLRIAALAIAFATATAATATGVAGISPVYADDNRDLLAQAAPAQDQKHERAERGQGPQGSGGPSANRPRLFSPEERAQFEQKMKGAKTPEERDALRKEMRAAVEQRAREKGVNLAQRPERPQLSGRDHQAFQERWANAKTQEERDALRKEMLAAVDQRAREKDAAQPGQPTPGRAGPRDGGGPMGGGPMGGGPMAQLFTQQERDQMREKMKGAKDRDERRKLMGEMHAMAEARAKEKGIKLPERGRPEHRPMRGPRPDGDATPRPQG